VKQRGYTLVLNLIVLLGVGSVWFAEISAQTAVENAAQRVAMRADQTLALSLARAALISYAVNYIDHYGAQGAGIGHLPCPDTDEPDMPDDTSTDSWHRDGPNPPCAQLDVEHGWLPRHVNVRDGRYHFHTRSHQRLLYAVSGQFVNNPVGRIVNPSTDGGFSFGQYTDVIAVLATPPLDADLAGSRFWLSEELMADQGSAYSLIRVTDLRKPSMQRVGGWLVTQLNNAMEQRCSSIYDSSEPSDCRLSEHSLSHCDSSKNTVLLHWLTTKIAPINCEGHKQILLSTFTLLEKVPIQRHWFMRNKWNEFVEISFVPDCLTNVEPDCRFVLLPIDDDMDLLNIQLEPVSGPVQQ